MAQSVKLADDIMALVRREADLHSRSVAGQITHWLRIGRALEHSGRFDHARLTTAREGRLARTEKGGHDAPEDKIRARYKRSQPVTREAVLRADRGMVFDNSRLDTPPQQMPVFANGRLIKAAPILPRWILTTCAAGLVI